MAHRDYGSADEIVHDAANLLITAAVTETPELGRAGMQIGTVVQFYQTARIAARTLATDEKPLDIDLRDKGAADARFSQLRAAIEKAHQQADNEDRFR